MREEPKPEERSAGTKQEKAQRPRQTTSTPVQRLAQGGGWVKADGMSDAGGKSRHKAFTTFHPGTAEGILFGQDGRCAIETRFADLFTTTTG